MKSQQSGFTLIELVIVLVVIGVLAAIAVPKFINLAPEAQAQSLKATARSLGSASVINYGSRKMGNVADTVAVANCTDVENALLTTLPAGTTITAAAIAADASVVCSVTDGTNTETFSGVGIL